MKIDYKYFSSYIKFIHFDYFNMFKINLDSTNILIDIRSKIPHNELNKMINDGYAWGYLGETKVKDFDALKKARTKSGK